MSEFSCTEVNRRCLQSLFQDQKPLYELLERVSPYHLGDKVIFAVHSKKDAKDLYIALCQSIEVISRIFTVPLKIVHKKQVLYLVPISNRLQLESIGQQHPIKGQEMVVATIEQTAAGVMFANNQNASASNNNEVMGWEQFLQSLAVVANSSEEELRQEILSMPLNQSTVNAITSDLFNHRLRRAKQPKRTATPVQEVAAVPTEALETVKENVLKGSSPADTTTDETQSEPKTSNGSNQQREILKARGLPVQFGVIKSLVPVPPPSRVTEASKTKEATDLKTLVQQALMKLNKSGHKHFSVLDHISRQSDAGKVYLDEFVKLHDFVDTKPKQKDERAGKIIAAAYALIQDLYPGKTSENTPIESDEAEAA